MAERKKANEYSAPAKEEKVAADKKWRLATTETHIVVITVLAEVVCRGNESLIPEAPSLSGEPAL